ncbi:MAG: hypothetical protein ACOCZT_01720 [Halanaerobiales bacterium]
MDLDKLPVLNGLRLAEAENILNNYDYEYNKIKTAPPEKRHGLGDKRVIAVDEKNNGEMDIIWSYEKYK